MKFNKEIDVELLPKNDSTLTSTLNSVCMQDNLYMSNPEVRLCCQPSCTGIFILGNLEAVCSRCKLGICNECKNKQFDPFLDKTGFDALEILSWPRINDVTSLMRN